MTAEEFRNTRHFMGLTQAAWGQRLGISRVHVARIEGGVHPVSPTIARLIGYILMAERDRILATP